MATFRDVAEGLGAVIVHDTNYWSDTSNFTNSQDSAPLTWVTPETDVDFTVYIDVELDSQGTYSSSSYGDQLAAIRLPGQASNAAQLFKTTDVKTYSSYPRVAYGTASPRDIYGNLLDAAPKVGTNRFVIRRQKDYVSPGTHRYTVVTHRAGVEPTIQYFNSTNLFSVQNELEFVLGGTSSTTSHEYLQGSGGKVGVFHTALSNEEMFGLADYENYAAVQTVNHLAAPSTMSGVLVAPSLLIDVHNEYVASVATGSGLMRDPGYGGTKAVEVDAAAATSLSSVVDPAVKTQNIMRALSDAVWPSRYADDPFIKNDYFTQRGYDDYVVFRVPRLSNENQFEKSNRLALNVRGPGRVRILYAHHNDNGTTFPFTQGNEIWTVMRTSGDAETTYMIDVPVDAEYLYLYLNNTSSSVSMYVDNPANDLDGWVNSAFMVDLGDRLIAPAAAATAQMVNPSVSTVLGALVGASAATAHAEMPGGYWPDAFVDALVADATARMGAAWFKTDLRVNAAVAEASGEVFEPTLENENHILMDAGNPGLSEGWAIDPELVNGREIVNDKDDPYWNRVVGRSLEGTNPPQSRLWLRLNERGGGRAFTYDPLTGTRTTVSFPISGVYEQGKPGPNGRAALRVDNAGMDLGNADAYSTYISRANGASLEFTVRVQPGHTGRMDLFNGVQDNAFSQGGATIYSHVSVRNGRLYATSTKGGTSRKRIDDGRWHHIVITSRAPEGAGSALNNPSTSLDIYIDGELDRRFTSIENGSEGSNTNARRLAMPRYYFGNDTGYAFRGELLEVNFRENELSASAVMDLYLDMFGYKAVRAGVVGSATADIFQGHKVESNLKRLLILTWNEPTISNYNSPSFDRSLHAEAFARRPGNNIPTGEPNLSPMLGFGYDENMDIGQYMITYQWVSAPWPVNAPTNSKPAVKDSVLEFHGRNSFKDIDTGERRFVNLQEDIDLSDFDVIAFQGYPNPSYQDSRERRMYEDFFASVNQALIDGNKLWITDAFLAADLGYVSRVDTVPVFGQALNGRISEVPMRSNDVRGYEVYPFKRVGSAVVPKDAIEPVEKPDDGSMPALPKGYPMGSSWGVMDIWNIDVHQNNGYRVVNEIAGLTDLPSWEAKELAARDEEMMLPKNTEHPWFAYSLENRSGEDFEWTREYEKYDAEHTFVKPDTGRGLKAGDEFYDFQWFQMFIEYWDRINETTAGAYLRQRRIARTWAVPREHLRIGTPVTTFRSTQWNDFGDEVPNPYRNHVRNAVVRPGDQLTDGRKVKGYAYLEFAEHPAWNEIAGVGAPKQLTFGPGMWPTDAAADGSGAPPENTTVYAPASAESDYTFDWDFSVLGRFTWSGGGQSPDKIAFRFSWSKDPSGQFYREYEVLNKFNPFAIDMNLTPGLPIAQDWNPLHRVAAVPHMTWNSRGLSWLTLVEKQDAEFSNTAADVATAQGSMLEATVETDFDLEVAVGAAQATGTIVAPDEASVKDANVMAFAATANGRMMGLQGGYVAEAATGFADMPQNVRRPLDIEEVLFFTLAFNQETIYLRMEEN